MVKETRPPGFPLFAIVYLFAHVNIIVNCGACAVHSPLLPETTNEKRRIHEHYHQTD